MNRDAETVPARHETPDLAELRDHIAATIHRRICEHRREDCIENLGDCERATYSAMPLVSTALDEGNALARLLADALNDAIRTLRELAEKAAGEPIPFDDFDLYAEVVDGALNAAAERDALVAAIERQKEGREYLRAERDALRNWSHDLQVELKGAEAQRQMLLAERDALAAAVERVRALHTPSRWYLDYCDDPACEREHVECNYDLFHDDDYRLVCETCSGGELEDTDDPTPYPCPTIRALDESETVHD